MKIRAPTHRGSDVAAANIERKHTALHKVSHHEHRKPHPTRAIPQAMRLLPFVPYRAASSLESFRKNQSMPAENQRQFWPAAAIMVAEFRSAMWSAERLSIAVHDSVIFCPLRQFRAAAPPRGFRNGIFAQRFAGSIGWFAMPCHFHFVPEAGVRLFVRARGRAAAAVLAVGLIAILTATSASSLGAQTPTTPAE